MMTDQQAKYNRFEREQEKVLVVAFRGNNFHGFQCLTDPQLFGMMLHNISKF